MQKMMVSVLAAFAAVGMVAATEAAPRRSTTPVPYGDDWAIVRADRYARYGRDADVVFLGDSLTHFWMTTGGETWARWWSGTNSAYKAFNFGFCASNTEHVLGLLDTDALDDLDPRAVVLMIGGNNIWHFPKTETVADTVAGVEAIVARLRSLKPRAKVILCAITPFGATPDDPRRVHIRAVNAEIRKLCDGREVFWCDFTDQLLAADGTYPAAMAGDGVHFGAEGYRIWTRALMPVLGRALAPAVSSTLRKESIIDAFWVEARMNEIAKDMVRSGSCDFVFLGDSLTEGWLREGLKVWNEGFRGLKKLNLGISGDRIESVNWRLEYGHLDGYRTRLIVYLIGANNVNSTPAEMAAGVKESLRLCAEKQPQAKVLLLGMLPFADDPGRERITAVNRAYAQLADGERVRFLDLSENFPFVGGRLPLMKDGQHLNEEGYRVYLKAVEPVIREMLK